MTFKGFIIFMVIWISGCAFVDIVVPDIANAWQMFIGAITAFLGLFLSGWMDN